MEERTRSKGAYNSDDEEKEESAGGRVAEIGDEGEKELESGELDMEEGEREEEEEQEGERSGEEREEGEATEEGEEMHEEEREEGDEEKNETSDYEYEHELENEGESATVGEDEDDEDDSQYILEKIQTSLSANSTRIDTPKREVTPQEMKREEKVEEEEQDHLTALYKEVFEENKKLSEANNELQTRLGEYFRDQKIDDMRERDKSANHEHRFNKILTQVQEWQNEYQNITNYYEDTILDMKAKLEEKAAKGNEVRVSFVQFKREIAKEAEYTRTGKKMQEKEIDQIEQEEYTLDKELEVVRLKNIMLKNHLQHLEKTLQDKEKLKDGLHLIDFEQLKIENQTFNEKIEERNEELQKLRKKINNTVQVLTHLKEKLQFVQAENQQLKKQLTELDAGVTLHRDSLGRMKQQRDVVRVENNGLRQASGLIGLDDLLRDYEICMNQLAASREKLQGLKDRHALLTMETAKYQQPSNNTKTNEKSRKTKSLPNSRPGSNYRLPPLTPK